MSLITIKSGIGCGRKEVSAIVAKTLNLELFDNDRLRTEALNLGIMAEELKGLDEKAPGFFDLLWSQKPAAYLDLMESVIYEVAKKGKGIIIGHGSHFLLRDFNCALHVLLSASEPFRIAQIMKESDMAQEVAEKMIRKNDHDLKGFLRFAFHLNWEDNSNYDLVINPEKIGFEGAAKLIIEAADSQAVKECSLAAKDAMQRLALKKKIEATLLKQKFELINFNIEVSENGVVELAGFVHQQSEKEALISTVKAVPGVRDLNARLALMPTAI